MAIEEAPQRADTDLHAFLRKRRLDLHERDVRRLLDEREDQPGMRLDAAERRSPPSAFGRASPCVRSRTHQRIALEALTVPPLILQCVGFAGESREATGRASRSSLSAPLSGESRRLVSPRGRGNL